MHAKDILKEVAETGSVKVKFVTAIGVRARGPTTELLLPVRRRTELLPLLPIRAQRVVLLAVLGVAQHLIGFVDLLEPFLRILLVLGDIGMVLQRQLAEGAVNILLARRPRHTQNLVVVLELDSHIITREHPGSSSCYRETVLHAIHAAELQLTEDFVQSKTRPSIRLWNLHGAIERSVTSSSGAMRSVTSPSRIVTGLSLAFCNRWLLRFSANRMLPRVFNSGTRTVTVIVWPGVKPPCSLFHFSSPQFVTAVKPSVV